MPGLSCRSVATSIVHAYMVLGFAARYSMWLSQRYAERTLYITGFRIIRDALEQEFVK